MSGLFGRVRIDAQGQVSFERLSDFVEEVGLEAREPTCTKECARDWSVLAQTISKAVFKKQSAAAFEATRAPVGCPKTGCARRNYERWAEWHVVGAWLAAKEEPAFFSWLALPGAVESPVEPARPNTGKWLPGWRMPEELRWTGPQDGIYARGIGGDAAAWIRVDLRDARVEVSDAAPRPLPAAAAKALRTRIAALRAAPVEPMTTPGVARETVLLQEPWGAVGHTLWFAFDDANRPPAAAALLSELRKLGVD